MNKENFYYKKYGNSKKVLIILPGWGDTRTTFDFYINNLKDKFTIYIFDYPGFGKSKKLKNVYTIYDYAKYFKDFLEKENIINPYIICHSFGCRISILLIGKYRVKVDRLIIIGGAGIKDKSFKRKLKIFRYKLLKKLVFFIPKKKKIKYLNKLIMKYGSSDYKKLTDIERVTFSNIVNKDLRKYIPYIYCPTLLIWGDHDNSTPLKNGKYMNKKISDSALITLKEGTHFVYLEYPLYILKIINNFFI